MPSQEQSPLYFYSPNHALPIVFTAIVSLLAILHIYQSFLKYRWYHFGTMMLWASLVWIAGFLCRTLAAYHPNNLDLYICQYVLILAGPVLYAASEYFILGRLLAYLPYHTPIQPNRVLTTFLLLSAAVESLTAAGASTVATNIRDPDKLANGLNLIKAGLLLQAILELCFCSLVILLEYRCRKSGNFTIRVSSVCYVLYITSIMMLVRCIFRTVQGFQESDCDYITNPHCSTIDRHEWFLWVFEVANITVFVAALAVFHPGRFLPRDHRIYLDPNEIGIERIGPGFAKATDRKWFVTLLDPFDLAGKASGKAGDRVDRFWERDNPVVGGGKGGEKEYEV